MKKAVLLLLLAAAPAYALDKAKLAQHLRENLSLDSRTEIVVQGDPVPSGISDLKKVTVLVAGAPYDVLLTKDEKKYIWGLVADLSVSPDAQREKIITLETGHSQGSVNAPVTLVEYSDLECSFCKKAHEIISAQLYKSYTKDQVRWVYKHFPLNIHPWSVTAAEVADCAAKQDEGAFWKIVDYYFKNQESLNTGTAGPKGVAEAKRLGLDAAKINACMDDPSVKQNIMDEKKEGTQAGVASTPTLFVNGRMRRGFRDFEDVKVLIDEKLKAPK